MPTPDIKLCIILGVIDRYIYLERERDADLPELREAMVVLKDGNVLERIYTFSCANRCSGISPNPILYQVEAKLHKKNKSQKVYIF